MIIATYKLIRDKDGDISLDEIDYVNKPKVSHPGFHYIQSYSPAEQCSIFIIKAGDEKLLKSAKNEIIKIASTKQNT